MTTRKEVTGVRDLDFSKWIRINLPDSKTGFMVTDMDFVLHNYKSKKQALVEVKTRCANVKMWQKSIYKRNADWIRLGMKASKKYPGWQTYGPFLVQFQKTSFEDGWCKVNGKKVTEDQLIKILSMDYPAEWCKKYKLDERTI